MLLPLFSLPLIESIGKNQALSPLQCSFEGRLGSHSFRPCINHSAADGGILGPEWDNPPSEVSPYVFFILSNNGEYLLNGGTILSMLVESNMVFPPARKYLILLHQPIFLGHRWPGLQASTNKLIASAITTRSTGSH